MNSAICTLFESDYHFGVASLINSLYKQGYRGSVYAGYKGQLPGWVQSFQAVKSCNWIGTTSINVAIGLDVHFLPLETDYHLTNYKPDFMLHLWEKVIPEAKAMYYFDPDIVIIRSWSMFDHWVTYGVALCEDVNSPLPVNHPRRKAWRNYFGKAKIQLNFKDSMYANGGFIGLNKYNIGFLRKWQEIQEVMADAIGGLTHSMFTSSEMLEIVESPFAPFAKTDQDALNATIEACNSEISFVGKDGMAFENGVHLMPHALGRMKPWKKQYILSALQAIPPSVADKAYWENAKEPIKVSDFYFYKRMSLNIASFIGRFYKKN